MVEATCPNCKAIFQLGDEFQGAMVQCGACGTSFQVGGTGGATDIDVICPGCKTVHQVPDAARGAEAECMICGLTFQVPATGNEGIATGAAPTAPRPPTPPPPAEPGQKNTSTIRLSRTSLSNTMQSRPKIPVAPGPAAAPAGGKPPSGPIPKPGFPPPAKPGSGPIPKPGFPPPPAAAPAAGTGSGTVPKPPAAPRPTIAAGPIPGLGVMLEPGETALAGKEHPAPFPAAAIFLTLLPVILLPITALVAANSERPALWISLGTAAALVAWGVAAWKSFAAWQARSGLLVTTRRAVMVVQGKVAASVPLEG